MQSYEIEVEAIRSTSIDFSRLLTISYDFPWQATTPLHIG